MSRYIKIEDITLKGVAVFDENLDVLVSLSDVRKALLMTPTADVAPKSEVDKLKSDLIVWKQNRFNLYQTLECYEMARQKVAREIFEEIEECCVSKFGNTLLFIPENFAELKKKYTEDKSND